MNHQNDAPTTRSFRVRPSAWNKAKDRAEAEGTTMSAAIGDLVEGYARGVYTLPSKRVVRDFPEPQGPEIMQGSDQAKAV